MFEIRIGKFSKRKNSTKRPAEDFGTSVFVALKENTAIDAPSFLISASDAVMDFNYCIWDDKYFFVNEVTCEANNRWRFDCELDLLATYKSEIGNTSAYVTYSKTTNAGIIDSRIPTLSEAIVTKTNVSLPFVSSTGRYITAINGKHGVRQYSMTSSQLYDLISNLDDKVESSYNVEIGSDPTVYTSVVDFLLNYFKYELKSADAYGSASENIRSCIWIPFDTSSVDIRGAGLSVGYYDLDGTGYTVIGGHSNLTDSVSLSIPWHFTDWRQQHPYSDVYMFLPFVGYVSLSSNNINNVSTVTVNVSISPSDGNIVYKVHAGTQLVGYYTGNCSANYAIGLAQQPTFFSGQIFGGAIQAITGAVSTATAGVGAGMAISGLTNVVTGYAQTNYSTIGGSGGAASLGVGTDIEIIVVSHDVSTTPDSMKGVLGTPTFKIETIGNLTGYVQCANASVSAVAHSNQLDSINAYLNSGFYYE